MPGYYVHLASCNPSALKNKSFVRGIELPDLLKKYYESYGIEGTRAKYNNLKTNEMPDFSYFESRIKQAESKNNNGGLHYGLSSNPDCFLFWNSLTFEQKKNPFYIGYLWHLLTDFLFYKCLDIESKFEDNLKKYLNINYSEFEKDEIKKLHEDWDKINYMICKEYPDVELPEEILELGIVKFINHSKFNYVDYDTIKFLLNYLRKYNPISQSVDDIIIDIMNSFPNLKENLKNFTTIKKKV